MRNLSRLLMAPILLSGCSSMVVTKPGSSPANGNEQYLGSYSLAESVLKISIAKLAAASDASAPAKETADKSATITNNIYTGSPPVVIPPTKDTDPAKGENKVTKVADGCDAFLKAYSAARSDFVSLYVALKAASLDMRARSESATEPTLADDRKYIVARLQAYLDQPGLQKQWADAAAKMEAYAANIEAYSSACPTPISVTIEEATEPDRSTPYSLFLNKSALSDDALAYNFASGYFTSITANSADRTGDVVVAVAKTVATVAVPATGANAAFLSPGHFGVAVSASDQATHWLSEARNDLEDIKKASDLKELQRASAAAAGDLDFVAEHLPPPLVPALPTEFDIRAKDLYPGSGSAALVGAKQLFQYFGTDFDVQCAQPSANGYDQRFPSVDGILVSSSKVCTLDVIRRSDQSELKHASFWVADPSKVIRLPIDRTAFVTNKTEYDFSGGKISKLDISRPSPVLAVVSLPLTIVNSITSSITGNFNNASTEMQAKSALINAETANIQAQQALSDAKAKAATDQSK